MKIFYPDSMNHKKLLLRDRCARIISACWNFGARYRELVIDACKDAGFPDIDEDDFLFLSDFTNLNTESLYQTERT